MIKLAINTKFQIFIVVAFLSTSLFTMAFAAPPSNIKDPRKERIQDQTQISRSAWWLAIWQSRLGQLPGRKAVKYSVQETANAPNSSVYTEDNVRKGTKNPSFSN